MKIWKSIGVMAFTALVLTGCGPGESGGSGGSTRVEPKEAEVMVFKGGYGVDFYETAASEYGEKSGNTVKVIGDSRIDLKVGPRMQKGDPPDLTYPGWRIDSWKAVNEGAVYELTSALKEPAYGSETPWGETFEPKLLKLGQQDGKQFLMPYFFSLWGWWYDPDLFAEKGWELPKTYADLLTLCQKIKASGMAPITYQGQYPDYMISGMLQPWIISAGGMDAMTACQNMEPGAWNSEPVVRAAKMILELRDMGYYLSGSTSLSHTEAQAEFLNRKAAMIPCGTWLESEMKDSMPAGRKMKFFLPPVLGDGKGDPSTIQVKIEPWFVPAEAKAKKVAVEYFKYLTSKEKATQFVKEKGTFMSIIGSTPADVPESLVSAEQSFKAAGTVWSAQWREWYPEFYKKVEGMVTELLNGALSPEDFAKKVEGEAEALRNNKSMTIHKYKVE